MNYTVMNIFLSRHSYSRFGIDGKLLINGLAVCDTIEHPRLHLPSGTYSIEIRHNDKLRRKVPTLIPENVRRSAFPIIGIGNGPFSLIDGSINVGQHLMAGVLVESADTFARLIDRLDKVDRRGEKIMLVIL